MLTDQKDIYERYRDSTTTDDNKDPFFHEYSTTIPKSPFDNVVGWINIKERGIYENNIT